MNIVRPELQNKTAMTVVCSYCGKLIKGQKIWNKEYLSAKEISLLPVSHGICKKCLVVFFPNEYSAIMGEDHLQKDSAFSND